MNVSKFQKMRCILCHNVQQEKLGQKNTQGWKGMVMYNKVHGTIDMSHHVASMHNATSELYKTQCFNATKHSNVHQKC